MHKRKLSSLSYDDYHTILKSGMFFEFYPDASGNYLEDMGKAINEALEQFPNHWGE